jgi:hypothetical protein
MTTTGLATDDTRAGTPDTGRAGAAGAAADAAANRGLFAVAATAPEGRAWTDADVYAYLEISRRKLAELVGAPGFPEPRRLGGRNHGRRWAPGAVPDRVADPERRRLEREGRVGARGTAARRGPRSPGAARRSPASIA